MVFLGLIWLYNWRGQGAPGSSIKRPLQQLVVFVGNFLFFSDSKDVVQAGEFKN